MIPNYFELRQGVREAPLIITTDTTTPGMARLLSPVNMYDCSFIYFINIAIVSQFDPLHFELCDYMLLRNR